MAHEIRYVPLDDLVPHPENPKNHDVPLIRASFHRFGFGSPVLRCDRTGYMAAGHGRRSALLAERGEGNDAPEGIVVTDEGVWAVPVVVGWASKDDEELKAYLVVDNRATEAGGWDRAGLANLLDSIAETPGLEGTGFSQDDLATMLERINPSPPAAFPSMDPDDMETAYRCPSCGYEWSGQPKPGEPTHEPPTPAIA